MKIKSSKGFSLIELLVVIGIIAVLMSVIMASTARSRSYGRDAEVRSQVQTIKLAFARAAQADPAGNYPDSSGTWVCMKVSGTCWKIPTYSANTALNNTLLPYMPSGVYPKPPGTEAGEYRHDAYLYNSFSGVISGYTGPILIWWQEKPFTDCPGRYRDDMGSGIYYCYEKLIK